MFEIFRNENTKYFIITFQEAFKLLISHERQRLYFVSFILMTAGIFDVLALASIMPVVTLTLQPEKLQDFIPIESFHSSISDMTNESVIVLLAFSAVILLIFSSFYNIFATWKINRFGATVQNRLGTKIINLFLNTQYSWFLEQNNATLVRFLHSDITRWGRDFIQRSISVVHQIFNILLPVLLLFYLAPFSGLLYLLIVLFISFFLLKLVMPKIRYLSQKTKSKTDSLVLVSDHAVNGIKDIKVSCGESEFASNFSKVYGAYNDASSKLNTLQQIPTIFLILFGQLALLLFVVAMWVNGYSTSEIASQVALIILVTSRIIPAITRVLSLYASLWNAIPWVKNLINIENEISKTQEDTFNREKMRLTNCWSKLEFKNVSFTYPKGRSKSLKNFSVCIEKNKSYGVVGFSGSGKSTLVDLLVCLYMPQEGKIELDGRDLNDFSPQDWRKNIGYVPQNPYFFDKSIRENIAIGIRPDEIDNTKVHKCLELSNSLDFVEKLEYGDQTNIGDRGVKLSGGQLQRIAIARALYQEPSILILDEASSHLDAASQREFQKCINKLGGTVTLISIAHRIETLINFDIILHVDDGKLIEADNYNNLKKKSVKFKNLIS